MVMKMKNIPALTTSQMVEVDRLMIEHYKISLVQMMENAGRNLAELAIDHLDSSESKADILILCGAGNNGGGGMVAARHLHNRGQRVRIALMDQKLKPVPNKQWQILTAIGIKQTKLSEVGNPSLIVDAMIGYGLRGDPRSPISAWIEMANSNQASIIALDAPSGLDTSSGKPGNPCIQAAKTLTLALPKIGLLSEEAKSKVGQLYLADIGVPPELYSKIGIEVPHLFNRETIISIH
jgi:NAD(P)H-hydrate epimerase